MKILTTKQSYSDFPSLMCTLHMYLVLYNFIKCWFVYPPLQLNEYVSISTKSPPVALLSPNIPLYYSPNRLYFMAPTNLFTISTSLLIQKCYIDGVIQFVVFRFVFCFFPLRIIQSSALDFLSYSRVWGWVCHWLGSLHFISYCLL